MRMRGLSVMFPSWSCEKGWLTPNKVSEIQPPALNYNPRFEGLQLRVFLKCGSLAKQKAPAS